MTAAEAKVWAQTILLAGCQDGLYLDEKSGKRRRCMEPEPCRACLSRAAMLLAMIPCRPKREAKP